MKAIFIRHAESTANAGFKTEDPTSITLTPEGFAQAARITLPVRPDLILSSRYIRTTLTAEPTVRKYPDVPYEIWDIQEFTYLSPDKYRGTTVQERTPMAVEYWLKGDTAYLDGPGAESFDALAERCRRVFQNLKSRGCNLVAAFSHQQFITALKWSAEGLLDHPDKATMHAFRAELLANPVKNCESVEFNF